ncbi:MAG: HEAT repeat domain-containing protein [Ignavibacteria bacterium]|nr:HEAT repeat domain-containing protein [Ignavibacteria bacterium]
MTQAITMLGTLALTLIVVMPAEASNVREQIGKEKYNQAVDNLLVGLQSDVCGLHRSCAYRLGDFESSKAIIPLMALLHMRDGDECCRIAAAWALCRIGDARGVYAVRQAVRFDPSEKVRISCAWFYNILVTEGTFEFVPKLPRHLNLATQ